VLEKSISFKNYKRILYFTLKIVIVFLISTVSQREKSWQF